MSDTVEISVLDWRKCIGVNYGNCGTFKVPPIYTLDSKCNHVYIGHFNAERMRADGLGMLKFADGDTWSGRCLGGRKHGHWLTRWADGTLGYVEYDKGTCRHGAGERTDGTLTFDRQPCDATDVRFLELKRRTLDVAVCPDPPRRTPPHPLPARGLRFAPQLQVEEAVRKIEVPFPPQRVWRPRSATACGV
jgi:hypothetical protein